MPKAHYQVKRTKAGASSYPESRLDANLWPFVIVQDGNRPPLCVMAISTDGLGPIYKGARELADRVVDLLNKSEES